MAWTTSKRKEELPPNWQTLRREAKRRAKGQCEDTRNGKRCTRKGRDLHHTNRDNHTLDTMQWLCRPCHNRHTNRQAKAAQHARYIEAKKRPLEAHPGAPAGSLPWL